MNPVDVQSTRVLIVDAKQTNVEFLERILLDDGFINIHTTRNPEQVLELHRKNDFDLVLLGLELPGLDRSQMIQMVTPLSANPSVAVIMLTASPDQVFQILQAGARDFIGKPFDKAEVLTRIRNVLRLRLINIETEQEVEELRCREMICASELQASEARFEGFTELASDWYWEQDSQSNFTKVSGPVPQILGIEVDSEVESTNALLGTGWDALEQSILRAKIAARESFLDFEYTKTHFDGSLRTFLVSGQPMFDSTLNFLGYRGIGVEINRVNKP